MQAARVDWQALSRPARECHHLRRCQRIGLAVDGDHAGRARTGQPRLLTKPLQISLQLQACAEHAATRHEHVDMPREGSQARVGRGDGGAARPQVAGLHPASPLGKLLGVVCCEPVSKVPHQHPIPRRREGGQRRRVADVDIRKFWRRTDDPHAGLASLLQEPAISWLPQPDGVEAQPRQQLQRLAVVVDHPREKRHAGHFEHAAKNPSRRVVSRRSRGLLGVGRRHHCSI